MFLGKGDKNAADKGSVDMMRNELNKIDMKGEVIIGEGEMDKAPRSRRQKINDSYEEELHRRNEIREKYFSENQDLVDIFTNHDDAC